ncbi:MAG: hypothetical protein IKJ58_05055 [Akkermansia sp.]|nr:hypothetical protein [Akkermansia sp.]
MAAPKLKVNTAAATRPKLTVAAPAGAKPKLNTGAAPAKRPVLKGAGGQTITPKPAPAPEPETAPVPETVGAPAPTPAPTPAPAPAPEPTPEPVVEETPAAAPVVEEAPAAEETGMTPEEAAAQAEYERQMEEYNRQMEEYNRQMAEYQAQQAAEQAAAAPEPAEETQPAPAAAKPVAAKPAALKPAAAKPAALRPAAAKPAAAKPAAAKPAAAKPAAKPAPAPAPVEAAEEYEEEGMSEEQLSARDAYLQQLQAMAEKKPFHKTPAFFAILGLFAAMGIGCYFYVSGENEKRGAQKARIDATNAILQRAVEINKHQIETLQDARAKGVNVVCSIDDAKLLLRMIVNPHLKDEDGRPAYGSNPKGTCQLACLLLAIASEMDPNIDALIFDTLKKNANKIESDIILMLLRRMALSNNEGINNKFRDLASHVASMPKWNKKGTVLAYIWESIGLRVTPEYIPEIIAQLSSEDLDEQLANQLTVCLDNILRMEEDVTKRQQLGDQLFDSLPERFRDDMCSTLGRSCSPKALAHYQALAEDPDKWQDCALFFACYYDDSIIPDLMEMKEQAEAEVEQANGDAAATRKAEAHLDTVMNILKAFIIQNRPRDLNKVRELIAIAYDKAYLKLNETLMADSDAEAEENQQISEQRIKLIRALGSLNAHDWVITILDEMYESPDPDTSQAARLARESARKNSTQDAERQAKYRARTGS